MVLIVTVPCNCLSVTLHKSYFAPFLLWSVKALREFKEEHNVTDGILKALLVAKFLFVNFSTYL